MTKTTKTRDRASGPGLQNPGEGNATGILDASFVRDLRCGARILSRSPGFSAIAILVLAIGLGAIASVTSILNEMLFKPYPFPNLDRLVVVQSIHPGSNSRFGVSQPDLQDVRQRCRTVEQVAGIALTRLNLTGVDQPVTLTTAFVSPNLFDLIGARPLLGRTFSASTDRAGGENLVLLDEEIWRSRFGSDRGAVGEKVSLNGRPYTVAGVVPASHRFPDTAQVWTLLDEANAPEERKVRGTLALARLKQDATREQALGELNTIARELERIYPETNKDWRFAASSLSEFRTGPWKRMLAILAGIVGCVLLISCANVGSLLLERAIARQRELAIRCALGAGRRQVLRLILAESLVLAVLGGALGIVFAFWFLRLIVHSLPARFAANLHFDIDPWVLGITLAASVLAAVLATLLPALRLSRARLVEPLKSCTGGASEGGERQRLRGALLVGEIALSFVLLVTAGLLVRSFLRLQSVDPGHRLTDVVAAQLVLPGSPYADEARRLTFYEDLLREVRSVPGVASATSGAFLPFASWGRSYLKVDGEDRPLDLLAGLQRVRDDYFETLGVPLLKGRGLNGSDGPRTEPVAVVNAQLARRLWGDRNPVGKRIWVAGDEVWRTIVGVSGDIKRVGLMASSDLDIYIPYSQAPAGSMILFVRASSGDPASLLPAVRESIRAVDANIPLDQVQTLASALEETIAPQRTSSMMIMVFGVAATILAMAGIYGFLTYHVTRRTREIGIRMALGANVPAVVRLVMGHTTRLIVLGLGIGLAGAALLTRLLSGFLFEVSPLDTVTYFTVGALFVGVGSLAALVPTLRAAAVHPTLALRAE